MSLIVNIFAGFGLITILVFLIIYIVAYRRNQLLRYQASLINPPSEYMQNTGIKCPDYWVNTGVDDKGNYICKNYFNVQTQSPKTGPYAGKCNSDQVTFTPINSIINTNPAQSHETNSST